MAALVLLACEPPPVVATADERQNSEAARIEGQLVITGPARGNVVLFLFDADRPPPPEGTGRPRSFTFVPMETVFGAAAGDPEDAGPFTAPFSFDLVPAGRFLIRGFIDRDGCLPQVGCRTPDFIPWYGVTAEPNAGDVGGAAVELPTGAGRVVEILRGDDGALVAATGVHVSFAPSATVPADRPAFRVEAEPVLDLTQPVTVARLRAEPIDTALVQQKAATFLVRFVDQNRDGVPDDANADGAPDLWPRVVIRKLADRVPLLVDENDLDRNGIIDEAGQDYARADGTTDGLPDAVVLAAGLRPDPLLALLTNPDGSPRMEPVAVDTLEVVIRPLALDVRDPQAPAPLKEVPRGRYAVIVLQFTGQSWRVPNELHPDVAPGLGLPPVESQAFFFEVR